MRKINFTSKYHKVLRFAKRESQEVFLSFTSVQSVVVQPHTSIYTQYNTSSSIIFLTPFIFRYIFLAFYAPYIQI